MLTAPFTVTLAHLYIISHNLLFPPHLLPCARKERERRGKMKEKRGITRI
jgi:hypothetical protein